MEVVIKGNFTIIIFMGGGCTSGVMRENSMEIGKIIKCMEGGSSSGVMEGCMKENMLMIRSREEEDLYGLMEEYMWGGGLMESNMGMECIQSKEGK
jgi:hypothetical protein